MFKYKQLQVKIYLNEQKNIYNNKLIQNRNLNVSLYLTQ